MKRSIFVFLFFQMSFEGDDVICLDIVFLEAVPPVDYSL